MEHDRLLDADGLANGRVVCDEPVRVNAAIQEPRRRGFELTEYDARFFRVSRVVDEKADIFSRDRRRSSP